MDNLSHSAHLILLGLPLLGIGILSVALLSLSLNKDKWLIPGTFVIIFAVASIGLAMEYGDQIKKMVSNDSSTTVALADIDTTKPIDDYNDDMNTDSDTPPEKPVKKTTTRRNNRKWTKTDPDERVPLKIDDDKKTRSGRRTVVVNPGTSKKPRNTTNTQPTRTTPTTTTRPATTRTQPAPAPTPVAVTTPKPVSTPSRLQPTPTPTPAPSRTAGGNGTLIIKIKGPLVETSQNSPGKPHLLVILSGEQNKVEVKNPSRKDKQHEGNDPSKPVMAYSYFWENTTITFRNVKPGWYFVLIDTGLDSPSAHQAMMIGSGQGKNDYNGTVEIKAGQTTTMEFGTKSWSSGKLSKIR